MITAKIIKDSISPVNKRIITWELEYPRFIHAELLTHRVFSRNAASSRAIPIETMIAMVMDNPAMPVFWGKNQAGMQSKEELDDTIKCLRIEWDSNGVEFPWIDERKNGTFSGKTIPIDPDEIVTEREAAKRTWLHGRNVAIETVRLLVNLKLHKQIANRILEPWAHIKVVMTTTESDNWYFLRDHTDAQPEIHVLASIMLELENNSTPQVLDYGQWHLPYVDEEVIYGDNPIIEIGQISLADALKLSTSLCAQVSYRKFDESLDKAIKIYERLIGSTPRHFSPFEHQATPISDEISFDQFGVTHMDSRGKYWSGNFSDWIQYRQLLHKQLNVESMTGKPL